MLTVRHPVLVAAQYLGLVDVPLRASTLDAVALVWALDATPVLALVLVQDALRVSALPSAQNAAQVFVPLWALGALRDEAQDAAQGDALLAAQGEVLRAAPV
jgi:hypothetical protein